MELNRKKELLRLVESIRQDINKQNCGNYIPKVLNALNIAKKANDKAMFYKALDKFKYTSFGGNSQKSGYIEFVDKIIKKKEYKINELTFDEAEFVFSWIGKVIKDKKEENNRESNIFGNKYTNNIPNTVRKNKRSNVMYQDKEDASISDSPFAKALDIFK